MNYKYDINYCHINLSCDDQLFYCWWFCGTKFIDNNIIMSRIKGEYWDVDGKILILYKFFFFFNTF